MPGIAIEKPSQMEVFNAAHPLPAGSVSGTAAVAKALESLRARSPLRFASRPFTLDDQLCGGNLFGERGRRIISFGEGTPCDVSSFVRLMLAFVSTVFAQDQERRERRRCGGGGVARLRRSFRADAKLEGPLYTRSAPIKGGLTEGPAAAPDGSIYFSDIPNGPDKGMIVRYDPKTNKSEIFTTDSGKSNGLFFDAKGFLIACEGSDEGGRRVSKWNVKTKERTTLADRFKGKRFNAPNDLTIDRQGRIYFTDPRYLGTEPRELEHRAVYRIDVDGKVVEVTHDISKPNGIALSPDEKTLYVLDHDNGTDQINPKGPQPKHGRMALDAFPLGDDGLVHGEKRTLIDFGRPGRGRRHDRRRQGKPLYCRPLGEAARRADHRSQRQGDRLHSHGRAESNKSTPTIPAKASRATSSSASARTRTCCT